MFRIIEVSPDDAEFDEPLGTMPKFWFLREGSRCLFKREHRGTGEDWAEKIASELCGILGIPHVTYELATILVNGETYRGVICESCVGEESELVLGNQLLWRRDPAYPAEDSQKYAVREHTVSAVQTAIESLKPPAASFRCGEPEAVVDAMDFFIGYLLFDALIANQDRHHQNWGAVRGTELSLAPTFDHGAAFARNLTDDERLERLMSNDRGRQIAAFAGRARSALYETSESRKTLGALDAAICMSETRRDVAVSWIDRIGALADESVDDILDCVPEMIMSATSKRFTSELIKINKRRIVERLH